MEYLKYVHWSYFLTEGEHSVSMIGVQSIGEPNADNFLPFEQLTEEIVVDWIEAAMDVDKMKENLQNQLADKIAPKVVTLQLSKPVVEQAAEQAAEQVVEPEA